MSLFDLDEYKLCSFSQGESAIILHPSMARWYSLANEAGVVERTCTSNLI